MCFIPNTWLSVQKVHLGLHLYMHYQEVLHTVTYRMICLAVNSKSVLYFYSKILTIEVPCKLLLQWLCIALYGGKWEAIFWYICICAGAPSPHTPTWTFWKGVTYLIVYVLVFIYFIHFIATFKVHGHIRFFLGSILFFNISYMFVFLRFLLLLSHFYDHQVVSWDSFIIFY